MTLEEFKKKKIEPLLKKEKKGIITTSKEYFTKSTKFVRNLDQITYRLLNFILYSHLFFFKLSKDKTNDFFKKYLPQKMTFINVLKENWNQLKSALQNKRVDIKIFMNLIFKDITEQLSKYKNCNEFSELNKYEKDLNDLVNNSLKKYSEYDLEYNKLNKSFSKFDNLSPIVLLDESQDYTLYEEKYPFYKYFQYTDYVYENKIKIPREESFNLAFI